MRHSQRWFISTRAFTLVELLVTVAVIGLLSSLVVQNFSNARTRSFDTSIKSGIRGYRQALELYNSQNKTYLVFDKKLGCSLGTNKLETAIPKGYQLQGLGAGCVGLSGGGEGQITRRQSADLPNYAKKSIADLLAEQGFLSAIQTYPGIQNFDKRNDISVTNGRTMPADFVLTLCNEKGEEATGAGNATNFALYAQVNQPTNTDNKRASTLCGGSGTQSGGWNITQVN